MYDWARSRLHREATQCQYGFASQQTPNVAESVWAHVRWRTFCHRRIVGLKEAVFGTRDEEQGQRSQMNRSVIDILDSHFYSLGEPVVCSQVKPLLADLLAPSPELRIPTPITAHVDQCPPCAADLETLRGLSLSDRQLERLRWLYARRPSRSLLRCWRARPAIPAFIRGEASGIDKDVLEHLSLCPHCRAAIYAFRQGLLQEGLHASDACREDVTSTDLFDCVVPYRDAGHNTDRSRAVHASTCPKCLETIQTLHRAIYGVAERPDSGVTTIYRTLDDAEAVAPSGEPYARHPVRVEVIHRNPQRVAPAAQAGSRRRVRLAGLPSSPRAKRVLGTAVAAAAMISVAVLLFLAHGSSAVTWARVVGACGNAENVHVTGVNPNTGNVTFEMWASRELGFLAVNRGGEQTVYNLAAGEQSHSDRVSKQARVYKLSNQERARVEMMANSYLNSALVGVRSNARWNHIGDCDGKGSYELVRTNRSLAGRDYAVRYEVVIDQTTRQPESLVVFHRYSPDAEWECKSRTLFKYMTSAEMMSLVKDRFFPDAERHHQ